MSDFKIKAVKKEPKSDFPNFKIWEEDQFNYEDFAGQVAFSNVENPGQHIYKVYAVIPKNKKEYHAVCLTNSEFLGVRFSLEAIPKECLILYFKYKKED